MKLIHAYGISAYTTEYHDHCLYTCTLAAYTITTTGMVCGVLEWMSCYLPGPCFIRGRGWLVRLMYTSTYFEPHFRRMAEEGRLDYTIIKI